MACKVEHDFTGDHTGIAIHHVGQWEIEPDKWQDTNVPLLTDECDQCAARTAAGKLPACVHHCQARVMTYGTLEELMPMLEDNSKVVLHTF
jgi:anaerobic dimethyl sulfoxide reductase subunit B (iron-sulfur subunit)